MRGDEDDRHVPMGLHQAALQLRPAHPRHADVEDQAVGLAHPIRAQELQGGGEEPHFELEGPEQGPEGVADRVIVVDDGYAGILGQAESFATPILALRGRRSNYTLVWARPCATLSTPHRSRRPLVRAP